MRTHKQQLLWSALLLMASALPAQAQLDISTLDGPVPPSALTSSWGRGSYAYGQTFTAPTAPSLLDSFSFWLSTSSLNAPWVTNTEFSFGAYLIRWDASRQRATGPVLWSQGGYTATSATAWQRYDFLTGGTLLDPTAMYVALLVATYDVGGDMYNSLGRADVAYSGGSAFYVGYDLGSVGQMIEMERWNDTGADLAFQASFADPTVAPEPATLALLGSGLAGVVGAARRRRRREE